jgi:hypothetical protein
MNTAGFNKTLKELYNQYIIELAKVQQDPYITKPKNQKAIDKICDKINQLKESIVNTHTWPEDFLSASKLCYCSICGVRLMHTYPNKKELREYISCNEMVLKSIL